MAKENKDLPRKSRAYMLVKIEFPVHNEGDDEEHKVIIQPMEYLYKYEWPYKNHMYGREEDATHIEKALREMFQFEIDDREKQATFYYQRATGAADTTHNVIYKVVFED